LVEHDNQSEPSLRQISPALQLSVASLTVQRLEALSYLLVERGRAVKPTPHLRFMRREIGVQPGREPKGEHCFGLDHWFQQLSEPRARRIRVRQPICAIVRK
jgi:hypothetical protein